MKCILLCAGYATRLYPLTKNKPKTLLSVGGRPVLEWILEKVLSLRQVDEVFIVTNEKFYGQLKEWLSAFEKKTKGTKHLEVVNDGTTSNENRLGGLGDLFFVLKKKSIEDDLLVIAGDNVFTFDLGEFIERCVAKRRTSIGLYDVLDLNEAKKLGIVDLDNGARVVSFEEKPSKPKTTLSSIGIYYYPKEVLPSIEKYIAGSSKVDGPGFFVEWFCKKSDIYGFVFKGKWFDIGSFETLEKADKELGGS